MTTPVLILPGHGGSGPGHWQTLWEQRHPHYRRVHQRDWEHPVCPEWTAALRSAVADCASPPLLVAHSLACLLVAHWAAASRQSIMGAFLVAIPDPDSPSFPAGTRGFSPIPLRPFPFPSLVVASSDDPFGSPAYAQRCASVWGSEYIVIGQAGHINADSGHGEWMEGQRLFQTFQASRLRRGE